MNNLCHSSTTGPTDGLSSAPPKDLTYFRPFTSDGFQSAGNPGVTFLAPPGGLRDLDMYLDPRGGFTGSDLETSPARCDLSRVVTKLRRL